MNLNTQFESDSPSASHEKLMSEIEAWIAEQRLRPGDRLPSARELGRRWDCSMLTMNRAIACLIAKGTLKREGYKLYLAPSFIQPLATQGATQPPCYAMLSVYHAADSAGLAAGLADAGAADMRLINVFSKQHHQREELDHLLADPTRVRGLVIWPAPDEAVREPLLKLRAAGVPCVVCDLEIGPEFDYVGTDHATGLQMGIDHLVQLGHREFMYVTATRGVSSERERRLGYEQACVRHGLKRSLRRVLGLEYGTDMTPIFDRWQSEFSGVTAIAFSHVWSALDFLEVCEARGVRVPHDVSLLGFDMIPHLPTRFTTLAQDERLIGAVAMGRLRQLIALQATGRSTNTGQVRVAPRLFVGTTTAAPLEHEKR